MLETQPDRLPTNKVLAMGLGTLTAAPFIGPAVAEVWPQIVPPAFSGPAMTDFVAALVAVIASMALAYFVPDRAGMAR